MALQVPFLKSHFKNALVSPAEHGFTHFEWSFMTGAAFKQTFKK